jgi:hypothetical protein
VEYLKRSERTILSEHSGVIEKDWIILKSNVVSFKGSMWEKKHACLKVLSLAPQDLRQAGHTWSAIHLSSKRSSQEIREMLDKVVKLTETLAVVEAAWMGEEHVERQERLG